MKEVKKDSKALTLEETKQKLDGEGLILNRELIGEIVNSQFEYTKKTIKSGFFESVIITGLGKFRARLNLIQIRNGKQKETGPNKGARGKGRDRETDNSTRKGGREES